MTTANARDPAYAGGAVGDGTTDDTAAIQAAINAVATSGGGTVYLNPGTYKISTLSFSGKSGVVLKGVSKFATTLATTDTTGSVIDMTNANFCGLEDFLLRPFTFATLRTAGAMVTVAAGTGAAQYNRLSRLRLCSGFKTIYLNSANNCMFEDIEFLDFNAAQPSDSLLQLDGTTVSCAFRNFSGGSAGAVTNACVYINGSGVDSVFFNDFNIVNFTPSTGMNGVLITNGRWIRFMKCSFESGTTGTGCTINGGKGIDMIGCHFLGVNGVLAAAGTAFRMTGGEILNSQQHGVNLTGGTHHQFIGVTVSDCSQASNFGYNGFNVAGTVTDFTIENCVVGNMYGLGNGNAAGNAVAVGVGAADRYVVRGNRATSIVLIPWVDGGTGTDKVFKDNVSVGGGFPSVASAATTTLPANADVINVTGTTTITSVTASYKGRRVTLNFAGILTFTDGSNLKLNGNFVTTADDTITLVSDGVNWIEVARSVN